MGRLCCQSAWRIDREPDEFAQLTNHCVEHPKNIVVRTVNVVPPHWKLLTYVDLAIPAVIPHYAYVLFDICQG